MSQLNVSINGDATGFAPNAVIEGEAKWEVDYQPKTVVLRLFWYTVGKGTLDVGIAEEKVLSSAPAHQENFRFQLPEAPYSFSGQLIALKWAIELVINNGKDTARVELVLSPWTEIPQLPKVEDKDQAVFMIRKQ